MSSPYRSASPPPAEPRDPRAFDPSPYLARRVLRFRRARETLAQLAALSFPVGIAGSAFADSVWPTLLALPVTAGLVVLHALYVCPACHRHSGISFSSNCARCGLHVDDGPCRGTTTVGDRPQPMPKAALVPVDPEVAAILKNYTAR